MERTKDGFKLSTGRLLSVNMGIMGIGPDEPRHCSEGSDGGIWESYEREDWEDQAGAADKFTDAEREEIAAYMISLWNTFRQSHD